MSSTSGPPRVHDSFLPALPFTPRPSSPPSELPCAPRRGCGRERPGPERGQGRAARAHHGEAGEQSRSPAGGFELGAAQVEFAPGQRLHRVLVEAHHLGVTLADPVRVGDCGRRRRRRPRGLPVPAAAAAPAAAAGAVAAAEGKLGAAAAWGRGGLRMHGARCKGAGRPGRLLGQRPPPRAAPPPSLEEAAAWPQRGSGLSRPAAKSSSKKRLQHKLTGPPHHLQKPGEAETGACAQASVPDPRARTLGERQDWPPPGLICMSPARRGRVHCKSCDSSHRTVPPTVPGQAPSAPAPLPGTASVPGPLSVLLPAPPISAAALMALLPEVGLLGRSA